MFEEDALFLQLDDFLFYVVDLESTNGTEVNGRRARRARLEDGDTIVLGSTELLFQQP